jgi:hypothetical protein
MALPVVGIPATGADSTLDAAVADGARVYNYLLGGKDNYAADRAAGDALIEAYPGLLSSVRANRAFLARTVRCLAGEAGIRQFLDIGTGIPIVDNTHEIAQAVAPGCRVAYVDNDPVVLTHARALLVSSPEGATGYIDADLRDPHTVLGMATGILDFQQPVAVLLLAVLGLIGDDEAPHTIVTSLMDAMPPGSYLVLSHVASDIESDQHTVAVRRYNELVHDNQTPRSHDAVMRFFAGLDMLDPGLVRIPEWRPRCEADAQVVSAMWGGVGRKRLRRQASPEHNGQARPETLPLFADRPGAIPNGDGRRT